MSPAREWDGRSYDRISDFMEQLGREVLDRLALAGDETVLDAGCGSGRVTELLLARLPRGRVIGVDGSADMIAVAAERLPAGTELLVQDLTELDLGGRTVDAVLSTATFHWIADHDALFAALRRVLEPGGRLVAQCGGVGNVAGVHEAAAAVGERDPYAAHLRGWQGPWHFSTPEDAERRLRAAGFTDVRTSLLTRPARPPEPLEYLRTIVLGSHLERLPADLHEAYVRDVADVLAARDPEGVVTIDYVRLNLDATAA
ncbi:methyltransferase domain-containing protein [Paraconexibacter antarcticus]|uniref:Methyltransferase domain-containing protein n=1 Tax=Paraconexibacter antarcticus TaxID=2949664 RepID=A0ABY5DR65_9ACTN|nr:class I SAM-dependent methyltransferase [Paraconexibacter antarcticus]UTI63421.1 methyltransferase domain-containing protein [Paraconexibacter antarcticus]